jgi:hypothetical protein
MSWLRRFPFWRLIILIVALTSFIRLANQQFMRRRDDSRPPSSPTLEDQRRKQLEVERLAGIRRQHLEATQLLTRARNFSELALGETGVWRGEIEPLGRSGRGRSATVRSQLARLSRERRMSAEQISAAQGRIESLHQHLLELAASDPPTRLPAEELAEIQQLERQMHKAHADWQQAVSQGRLIVLQSAAVPPSPVNVPPAPVNVPSAPVNVTPAPVNVTPAAENVPPAPTANTPDVARSEPATAPVTNSPDPPPAVGPPVPVSIEPPVQNEEGPAREETPPEEVPEYTPDTPAVLPPAAPPHFENDVLRQEALSPEVASVLAPFIEPRYIQPQLAGGSTVVFRRTAEQQPMSLSRLEGMGALADSLDGLKILARTGTNRKLPPPRWSFSNQPRLWTPQQQEMVHRAQQLLRRLGPALVREGKLSP